MKTETFAQDIPRHNMYVCVEFLPFGKDAGDANISSGDLALHLEVPLVFYKRQYNVIHVCRYIANYI